MASAESVSMSRLGGSWSSLTTSVPPVLGGPWYTTAGSVPSRQSPSSLAACAAEAMTTAKQRMVRRDIWHPGAHLAQLHHRGNRAGVRCRREAFARNPTDTSRWLAWTAAGRNGGCQDLKARGLAAEV